MSILPFLLPEGGTHLPVLDDDCAELHDACLGWCAQPLILAEEWELAFDWAETGACKEYLTRVHVTYDLC